MKEGRPDATRFKAGKYYRTPKGVMQWTGTGFKVGREAPAAVVNLSADEED
jgi:hypothetical protein